MNGSCGCGWLERPGDTKDEARAKVKFFPFAICITVGSILSMAVDLMGDSENLKLLGLSVSGVAGLIFIAGVVTNTAPVGYLLDSILILGTLSIVLLDLNDAANNVSFPQWTFVVLALDIALVFKRDHITHFVIPFVI
eukprot:Hpha_TRINITY_DN23539_c0_g1::TRINITY_DN23539_c0_g1_i1::g.186522::m.186522